MVRDKGVFGGIKINSIRDVAQQVDRVLYFSDGRWFDPLMLQSACRPTHSPWCIHQFMSVKRRETLKAYFGSSGQAAAFWTLFRDSLQMLWVIVGEYTFLSLFQNKMMPPDYVRKDYCNTSVSWK